MPCAIGTTEIGDASDCKLSRIQILLDLRSTCTRSASSNVDPFGSAWRACRIGMGTLVASSAGFGVARGIMFV
jgi:hypothetical protein